MSADKRPHGPSRSSKERQYGAVLRPPVMEEREPWSSRSSSASRHSPLRYAASHEYSSESSGVLAYHPSSVNYDSPTASQSVAGDQFKRQWTKVRRVSGTCRSRVPRGAGSFLVFLLNVIESLAFYGALDSILRALLNGSSGFETGVILLVQYTAGRLLYPVAGFLADVYFGRYRMIHIGVWLFWIAFALLALSLSIASGIARDDTRLTTIILPIIAFVLISAGSSAIEVTIIPFGVDQLSQGASSEEQSSYFYWYYFGRQLGVLVGISTFYGISLLNIESGYHNNLFATGSIQSLEALAGMTLALILLWWFNTCLFKDKQRENPLKLVINILYYTATVKERGPIKRRAFRYGEGKKSRIERAKFQYDGLYTSEEVEDVKTFCKILLILFSLGLCFMTYTGVSSVNMQVSNCIIILVLHVISGVQYAGIPSQYSVQSATHPVPKHTQIMECSYNSCGTTNTKLCNNSMHTIINNA